MKNQYLMFIRFVVLTACFISCNNTPINQADYVNSQQNDFFNLLYHEWNRVTTKYYLNDIQREDTIRNYNLEFANFQRKEFNNWIGTIDNIEVDNESDIVHSLLLFKDVPFNNKQNIEQIKLKYGDVYLVSFDIYCHSMNNYSDMIDRNSGMKFHCYRFLSNNYENDSIYNLVKKIPNGSEVYFSGFLLKTILENKNEFYGLSKEQYDLIDVYYKYKSNFYKLDGNRLSINNIYKTADDLYLFNFIVNDIKQKVEKSPN